MCNGYITADGLTRYTMVARHAPAGCGAVRRRYVVASEALYAAGGSAPSPARANSSESALLEADDAVADVLGVRVHGRRHDPRHVVRQVVGRVEARVARPIPPALPVFCAPGKKAEAPGTAAPYASERLYYEGHYLVTFCMSRVVVQFWRGIKKTQY